MQFLSGMVMKNGNSQDGALEKDKGNRKSLISQIEEDFEGEFPPIKSFTTEEIAKDKTIQKFILRRKISRKLEENMLASSAYDSEPPSTSSTDDKFQTPPSSPSKSQLRDTVQKSRQKALYNFSGSFSMKEKSLMKAKLFNSAPVALQSEAIDSKSDPIITSTTARNTNRNITAELSDGHKRSTDGNTMPRKRDISAIDSAVSKNLLKPTKLVRAIKLRNSDSDNKIIKDPKSTSLSNKEVDEPRNLDTLASKNILEVPPIKGEADKLDVSLDNVERQGKDESGDNGQFQKNFKGHKLSDRPIKLINSKEEPLKSNKDARDGSNHTTKKDGNGIIIAPTVTGTMSDEVLEPTTVISDNRIGEPVYANRLEENTPKGSEMSRMQSNENDFSETRTTDPSELFSQRQENLELSNQELNSLREGPFENASEARDVSMIKSTSASNDEKDKQLSRKRKRNSNDEPIEDIKLARVPLINSRLAGKSNLDIQRAREIVTHNKLQLDSDDFKQVKKIVLSQLHSRSHFNNLKATTLKPKYEEIYKLFEHTVKDGESHSALLIGPRSSGKTSIVNCALNDLTEKFPDNYLVIKLNSFHQTDDRTALREIARQLDQKFENEFQYSKFEARSINETFENILNVLDTNSKDSGSRSIAVIFVIEEFDLFTANNRQTLLYNLFDLSQTSSTPICVLGITSKITTRESLEKRVRSRFSQRVILINKSATMDEFWSDCKQNLMINEKLISEKNFKTLQYPKMWNEKIEKLYNDDSSVFKKIVFQNFHTIKNFKEFNNDCIFAISATTLNEPFPLDSNFSKYLNLQSVNDLQSIIHSLSDAEILLVISAARCIAKLDLEFINFNLAYEEYLLLVKILEASSFTTNKSNSTSIKINLRKWSFNAMKNIWDNLSDKLIIIDSSTNLVLSNKNQYTKTNIGEHKMVQLEVNLEELNYLISDSNQYKKLLKL